MNILYIKILNYINPRHKVDLTIDSFLLLSGEIAIPGPINTIDKVHIFPIKVSFSYESFDINFSVNILSL